ncbi:MULTISPECIES: gamma-glutamyl-gamma-aminobutyrate hydrolase family protein [Thermoactinomyces]|jgi:putative glutamine amidotransferase|uniref:Gamma-glutamyl-gamma-aminobutyrate hydrolase family protein n=1 Tax=Thermoactinomyces daqus TaxID=1329516 RepID=A0A7W2AIP0_9BACL|nr:MULTISPECIES: gamma-glutamyl-gamma-aminobutyrate hydrolase family protein [Thermoactinomyces]MBA4543946.1 gamma-glutamyl-gamma-aminobutyrate hydrolase family protein [Thermoactinomyces daqus]MBH8597459.1 gamma-glutamyl-gamma-aminobutyrate hydrolase family protein [Thermoactinomyces sp. CICC 10523]MBH8603020.1 gamma-glutamyl-gamma-aminobutyrate hydrolase family protein [Thermoactinomyces sp. CICC 10522]MBH8609224.1 gamma-glutamyl-gamma-aminobutyrate hydrolase family protein [Thermoactinomyces
MKPVIGITMSLEQSKKQFLSQEYSDVIIAAGGIPFLLPYTVDDELIAEMSRLVDGLLLTGGGDIDPTLFDEEPHPGLGEIVPDRDEMEIALIEQFNAQRKPILGICRGCQILNIAMGGDMYQDLPGQKKAVLQHQQKAPRSHASHTIQIAEDSLLYSIFAKSLIKVNSFHHQAVRKVVSPLKVTAVASDGVIEAFESIAHEFVVGVQWHPESMVAKDDHAKRLFRAFVAACEKRKEKSAVFR